MVLTSGGLPHPQNARDAQHKALLGPPPLLDLSSLASCTWAPVACGVSGWTVEPLASPGTPAAKPIAPPVASTKSHHHHHRGSSGAQSRSAPHAAPTWLFELIEASQAGW